MDNFFYKALATAKLNETDFFELFDIVKKYGTVFKCPNNHLISSGGFLFTAETPSKPTLYAFKAKEDEENYYCFFGNMVVTLLHDIEKRDRIVRICLKRPQDEWSFRKNEEGQFDVTLINNVNAEVYIKYNVDVMGMDRCFGDRYKSGSWNKEFYKTLKDFIQYIRDFTEINKIDKAYQK